MGYLIGQMRYKTGNDNITTPSELYNSGLLGGKYLVKLGIQAPPGTKFWINSDPSVNAEAVIVGITGIYELDLMDLTYISSLQFDKKSIDLITESNNASLVIDFVYEQIGGEDLQ